MGVVVLLTALIDTVVEAVVTAVELAVYRNMLQTGTTCFPAWMTVLSD